MAVRTQSDYNGPQYQGMQLPTRGGNPFAMATGMPAGVDPWAGMRSSNPMSSMAAMASGGQPSSRLPGYNPMGDPQGPLARAGWIGSLIASGIGGPTREEAMLQRNGTAQTQAFQTISRMVESGMPVQRAIVEFMGTPEGQDFFATGNGMTDLANYVKGITPPAPETIITSAGQQAYQVGADGTVKQIINTPTSEVQTFNAMAELGNLSPEEIEAMSRAQMAASLTGDVSDTQAAMSRLVASGRITQETADLIVGGVLTTTPILNSAGETIGHGVIDKSQGGIKMLENAPVGTTPQPGQQGYVPGVSVGTRPEDAVAQQNGPHFQGLENPADILDSAGPAGWLIEHLGAFTGIISPELAPIETTRNRKALTNIQTDAQQLAKDGRVLAQELGAITSISNNLGPMTLPEVAAVNLINLHDLYDNREVALTEIANDPNTTNNVRGDAAVDLANLRRAKANLPSRESLTAKLETMKKAKPLEQLGRAFSEGKEKVGGVVDEIQQPDAEQQPADRAATPNATYDDEETIRNDWKSGKLTKGMTVIFKGQPHTIEYNYGEK